MRAARAGGACVSANQQLRASSLQSGSTFCLACLAGVSKLLSVVYSAASLFPLPAEDEWFHPLTGQPNILAVWPALLVAKHGCLHDMYIVLWLPVSSWRHVCPASAAEV